MDNLPRDFKGIWIPKLLWLDKRLTPMEKILAAEIDSLDCSNDHCYASNQYFAEFFDLQDRSISQMITKLKNLGLIEVHSFDGRIRRLKSNLQTAYAEFYGSAAQSPKSSKQDFTGLHTGGLLPSPIGDSIERENKDESKDYISPIIPKGDALPAAPKQSKKREKISQDLKERAPQVFMTDLQHEALLKKVGNDESKAKKCYEILSDWKVKNMVVGGSDYASMTKWVIKAMEKELLKPKPQDSEEINKKISENIKKIHNHISGIIFGHNYIEFDRGQTVVHVKFSDYSFRDVVKNELEKMNLSIKGIFND